MALDLSTLTAWVDENSTNLLVDAIAKGDTISNIDVMPGVKGDTKIKYLGGDVIIAAGGCGFTASGVTTITDKKISVAELKINEEICPEDLNDYSTRLMLRPGYNEAIPFAAQYSAFKVAKVQLAIEEMIWGLQSATTTSFQGLLNQFNADAVVNDVIMAITGTSLTSSDYLAFVYALQNALPEAVQSMTDLTLFVGYPIFRAIVQAFTISNFYHIDSTGNDGLTSFTFPGTNIKVLPVHGLDAKKVMVLTPASNLVYATDIESESSNFQIWWSQDSQVVKTAIRWKSGVSYYFPDWVAYGHTTGFIM